MFGTYIHGLPHIVTTTLMKWEEKSCLKKKNPDSLTTFYLWQYQCGIVQKEKKNSQQVAYVITRNT